MSARASRRTLVVGLVILLFGSVIAQAPITSRALPTQSSALPIVSLRFYYTPLAAAFVLCALALNGVQIGNLRRMVASVIAFAIAFCIWQSKLQTQSWAAQTTVGAADVIGLLNRYAEEAGTQVGLTDCVVNMSGATSVPADFDLRFKATLKPGDPRVNCVLITSPPQAQVITRTTPCDFAQVSPARPQYPAIRPTIRSGTCTFFFPTL